MNSMRIAPYFQGENQWIITLCHPDLTPPVSDKDHAHGSSAAHVTLVEYGDFECPACGQAYPIVKAVQEKMGLSLRFVFRNFPLTDMHPHAEHAAEAAQSAGVQGKFWEMHDKLFTHQNALDDSSLQRYAEELRLHTHQFSRDMSERAHASEVRRKFKADLRAAWAGLRHSLLTASYSSRKQAWSRL